MLSASPYKPSGPPARPRGSSLQSGETAASAVSVSSGRPQTAPKPSFRLCISESAPILHFSCSRPISDLIFSDVDHLRQALS